ncbi:MAG: inositol monophosphatase family protein [Cyanobacteria bacterium P01_E01_bin.34]
MPERMELLTRLDIATEAASAAGAVLQQLQGNLQDVREKRPGDLVTEADRQAEATVLEILQRHYPQDSILAEESGALGDLDTDGFLWAIDPLDGTTNFAHGYPAAAVSIGLLLNGEPVMGVVFDVFRNELFRACQGMGTTCNRRPIQVSDTRQLQHSLLVTGFAYDRRETSDNNYAEFCHFTHLTQGVRRGGSASVDLASVAMGRLDGYWERGLSVWDIAAGIVLVREAGGRVTAYDGSPLDIQSGRLLASTPHLHSAIQTELSRVQPLNQVLPQHPAEVETI